MTIRFATAKEIRTHYERDGAEVRITKDGHVTYRLPGETTWREGRFVEEYRTQDGGNGNVWLA